MTDCPKCTNDYAVKLTVSDRNQAQLMADLNDIDEYCLQSVPDSHLREKAMYVHEYGNQP